MNLKVKSRHLPTAADTHSFRNVNILSDMSAHYMFKLKLNCGDK